MMQKLLVSLLILFSLLVLPSQGSHLNRSLEFSIRNHKNQTGHWNVEFQLGQASSNLPKNWKVNFKYNITDFQGIQAFKLFGTFSVPPSRPADYELFPGIGYYKFHPGKTAVFDEAVAICAKEGGHLAIINSEEEANVIKMIYARYPSSHKWAMVGFDDRKKQGDYVTIFGDPLPSTGYNKWHPNEPDYSGGIVNCGCIETNGLYGVVGCDALRPFFCEYDLVWDP